MQFSWDKAVAAFIMGFIFSLAAGIIFQDSGIASMTAVCYVGAIIVGLFSKKSN